MVNRVRTRVGLFLLLQLSCACAIAAGQTARIEFTEEFSRQERIYLDQDELARGGYVVDRSLAAYAMTLSAEFDRALTKLGPNDRWLDIGAGQGKAVLDYYGWRFDVMHKAAAKRNASKAKAVAISIEDRRTAFWHDTAATLQAGQIQYLCNKRFGEYSADELGQFNIITDVFGGLSYTDNLSHFMEKALTLLQLNGNLYTVLQDVHLSDRSNAPYYPNSTYLTEIEHPDGSELTVCEWLKSIKCIEVGCEARTAWKPPIEVYSIRKVCSDINVPNLRVIDFQAGTPPARRFRLD
jgi:hypothetical protein